MTVSFDNKYAVVGMGGIFPDAQDIEQYWSNILEKKVSIGSLPSGSVERDVFYRPNVHSLPDKQDRSYTDLWATIDRIDFDARKFMIPPKVVSRMDNNQKLSLLAAEQAIAFGALNSVSKDRVSVIIGNTMIGQLHHEYLERFDCDKYEYYLRQRSELNHCLSKEAYERLFAEIRQKIVRNCPSVTEDTAPGVLPNIIAARINAVFDLHGHAFTVDAACASGLAAIICGLQQLKLGEADAVICGAVDFSNKEVGRIYFSGIGALSPDGSFPFDQRANGFIVGDGAGIVILKRLEDALNANDRIIGLISGYGQVSDGKGKAIAAPNELWQAQAIRRAWDMAKVHPDQIELIEAHGTSTQVGDLSEVLALKRAFRELGVSRRNFCGIGSVKSNIGHLKSAAGIAGFLKALLAIDRKVLPPTANFRIENPKLELSESPFYVLSDARDWSNSAHPRYAGVSAFGFGGADYHIALEEYRERDYAGYSRKRSVSIPPQVESSSLSVNGDETLQAVFFSAEDISELSVNLEGFLGLSEGKTSCFTDLIAEQNLKAKAKAGVRLAFPVSSLDDLRRKTDVFNQWKDHPNLKSILTTKGIAFETAVPVERDAVALLFPGQGSQYADMMRSIVGHYAGSEQTFIRADRLWRQLTNVSVSELIDSSKSGKDETERRLKQTQNTHPTLFVTSLAVLRILEEMGLKAATMVGHSVGEFTALAAAQKLSFNAALKLVHARASAFASVPEGRTGSMLALSCNEATALQYLDDCGVNLAIANVNSPIQTIVSGCEVDIDRLIEYCGQRAIKNVRLNVSHAFHSPLMEPAETSFREALRQTDFRSGAASVVANRTNEYYENSSEAIRLELNGQITGSVRFAKTIERLYETGARLFVEVGPSSVLSQLVRDTLGSRDVTVLSSDNKRGDSMEAFVRLICGLFAAGIEMDPSAAPLKQPVLFRKLDDNGVVNRNAAVRSKATIDEGETLTIVPPVAENRKSVVYSGVSIGLPGSFKNSFRDDNFDQLCEGRNLIERLTDDERQRLVDLRITKVVKSEQGAAFATLNSLNEVIQLAGKIGQLKLGLDYSISEKDIATMSSSVAHAVAAGYEALADARIPLVHEYTRTIGGTTLPERWALPKEMQRHTGVIFANGFPIVDPIIKEVSRYLSDRYGSRMREEIFEFYDSLISRITDKFSRKLLSDWYALNCQRLAPKPSTEEVYQFNHQLMTQIAMQANNRLARFVNARGPNFQINAACSSTSTAITLAEELIRSGRAKRMIVIGADDPSSEYALPYLGAGFLSTGACTNAGDLHEAALPFDKRRNGMIMGAGAVGIVVEDDEECERRGIVPVCELVGSHCFNTAGHPSQLDVPRYAEELDMFMTRMEGIHGFARETLSKKLVYVSHETYTPARGGCSEAEAVALRHVFGDAFRNIEISNTKGMTGHTMGASIEDAVAAKALQFGKAPPVVNHRVNDPALEGLRLGTGAPSDFEYALRMAAGFGSQGNYILLKRRAKAEQRTVNPDKYAKWVNQISGLERATVTKNGRRFIVKDDKPGSIVVDRPDVEVRLRQNPSSIHIPANPVPKMITKSLEVTRVHLENPLAGNPPNEKREANQRFDSAASGAMENAIATVVDVVASITGYDPAILDLDMELEADLGIDTVKQATVLSVIAERFKLTELSGFKISEYPTLRSIAEWCRAKASPEFENVGTYLGQAARTEQLVSGSPTPVAPSKSTSNTRASVAKDVLSVIATVTGYEEEILGEDMELEADLGIDTVKQATVLSMLGERGGHSKEDAIKLSNFSSIRDVIEHFVRFSDKTAELELRKPLGISNESTSHGRNNVAAQVVEVIAEVTGYSRDILAEDMELEADLGVDTVKQATVLSILGEKFAISRERAMAMSSLSTIRQMVDYFYQQTPSTEQNERLGEADTYSPGAGGSLTAQRTNEAQPREKENGSKMTVAPRELLTHEDIKSGKPTDLPTRGNVDFVEGSSSVRRTSEELGTEVVSTLARLTQLIEAISSYPKELLEPDTSLKSDLELSDEVLSKLKSEIESTFSLATNSVVLDDTNLLALAKQVVSVKVKASPRRSERIPNVTLNHALGRQVTSLIPAPRGSANTYDFTKKRVWVVGDVESIVENLSTRLKAMGCVVHSLVVRHDDSIEMWRKRIENSVESGAPKVLIDLTSCLDVVRNNIDEPSIATQAMERAADYRFVMCKCLTERRSIPERVLVVTTLDGRFGLVPDVTQLDFSPFSGLTIGFYKAIRREWSDSFLSILDLEPKDWESEGTVALQMIERELAVRAIGVEVCYLAGERHRVVSTDSTWSSTCEQTSFEDDEVVVVTGGGAGIAAQVALEIGRQAKLRFALIGRTKLDPTAKGVDFSSEEKKVRVKASIQRELSTSLERVTPSLIEKRLNQLQRSAEIYETLDQLAQMGCNARYFSADVCDLDALRTVVDTIREQLGPITTIIYGAALDRSRQIEQKSLDEFRGVYSVKARGAYYLHWLCRNEPIRRCIAMSSISSRFGNFAQTDYCAGNAFLDFLMRSERRPNVRAISLLWSGWSQLGMAWRNSYVREHAEQKGLNLIPPEDGVRAAIAEILSVDGPRDVLIHRGLADVADPELTDTDLNGAPFIDWVEKRNGKIVTANRRFSPKRDAFLNQHRFAGVPYMPGVGFMEMMAEAASLVFDNKDAEVIFENLSFVEGFKLHREEPRDVCVDISESSNGKLSMTVRAPFKTKIGNVCELREYAKSFVSFRKLSNTSKIESMNLALPEETSLEKVFEDAKSRKQNVHLGPLFNDAHRCPESAKASKVRYGQHGIEMWVRLPKAQLNTKEYPIEQFLCNPAFLDSLHQAGAILSILLTNQVYLPVGAEQFVIYERPTRDEQYRVIAKLLSIDASSATFNMSMVRNDGTCCVKITNSRFSRINA
jgi:acyl transferase domain-containing protein/NAD(P)-dependent dehydrogenase (short-subunit alcohol dehydrogenase family)